MKARPVRILVLNWQDRTNPRAGGAEIHVHEIFGRLAARGHEVSLLCSGWKGAAAEDALDGIRVVRTGTRYTFPLHGLRAFVRHLGAGPGFDVIVEDVNKCPLFTPLWSKTPVVLLVPHLFGTTAFRQESLPVAATVWAAERLMPAVYRSSPVIAISESTADDLGARGFDRRRITVSYPGIDRGFFRPDPEATRFPRPTLLYAGRLERYKGVDVVLRAIARLRASGTDVALVAIGKGGDEARLRALARRLGVDELVTFAGYVAEEEKRDLLRRAWANVYPSPKEGWGISNVEAAACGTPSLASDAPGLRESVVDGSTGFLVPVGSVEAWADRIALLCGDPDLRARLADGALEHAAGFTWERTADETEEVLRSVAV
ncbi:MAG: glycosyltransferase family 4 protein [Gemmatimonadota bacterium]